MKGTIFVCSLKTPEEIKGEKVHTNQSQHDLEDGPFRIVCYKKKNPIKEQSGVLEMFFIHCIALPYLKSFKMQARQKKFCRWIMVDIGKGKLEIT